MEVKKPRSSPWAKPQGNGGKRFLGRLTRKKRRGQVEAGTELFRNGKLLRVQSRLTPSIIVEIADP